MAHIEFEVLEDFTVRLLGKKRTEVTRKKGQLFTCNTDIEYQPRIDSLIEQRKIRKVGSAEESKPQKQPFFSFSRKPDDTPSTSEERDAVLEAAPIKKDIEKKLNKLGEAVFELNNKTEDIAKQLSKHASVREEVGEVKKMLDDIARKLENVPRTPSLHDLNNCFTEIRETLNKQLHNVKQNIREGIDAAANRNTSQITNATNQNTEGVNRVTQATQAVKASIAQVEEKLSALPGKLASMNEQIEDTVKSATRSLRTNVEETKEAMEALQGKANVLEDLKGKLDKVNITAKLHPFDHEDDVVVELAEQGQLILEQLATASRHYVAQKRNIQLLEEENAKLKHEREQIAALTEKTVEQNVRNKVTNEMITNIARAFANLDDVYTDEKLAGVQALLHNHGLVRSDIRKKGDIIDVMNENRVGLEKDIAFEFSGEGQYEIVQSQFVWKDRGETFIKAKAEKWCASAAEAEEPASERND